MIRIAYEEVVVKSLDEIESMCYNVEHMVTKKKTDAPLDSHEYPIREHLLTDEEKELVADGTYYLLPGKDKPVIRWSAGSRKGQLVVGTGVPPKHRSLGEQSKENAYKHTAAYKELMQVRIPAENDPDKFGTFAWLIQQMLKAIEGGDVFVDAQCVDCGTKFKQKAWKKPDTQAGIKLIELYVGRATETKEVSMSVTQMYQLMDETVSDYTVTARTVGSQEVIEERMRIVEAAEISDLTID